MKITITTTVAAPVQRVWSAWTTPGDIERWNFASETWCCPRAELDLREGGQFSYRMEAKDGTAAFDFEGTFIVVEPHERLAFDLGDGRPVVVAFETIPEGVRVTETFEAEDALSAEQQRSGWQAILDNFKRYVEAEGSG